MQLRDIADMTHETATTRTNAKIPNLALNHDFSTCHSLENKKVDDLPPQDKGHQSMFLVRDYINLFEIFSPHVGTSFQRFKLQNLHHSSRTSFYFLYLFLSFYVGNPILSSFFWEKKFFLLLALIKS